MGETAGGQPPATRDARAPTAAVFDVTRRRVRPLARLVGNKKGQPKRA